MRRRLAFALIGSALAVEALSAAAAGAAAAVPKAGGTCPSRSVGAVTRDAKGQPLVCSKISRTKFQWKLPALGSFLRPIPLGQSAAAGPASNRFSVRVTQVDADAAPEIAAEHQYATPPPEGTRFIRLQVEATFLGPAATGSTGHYWYARGEDGTVYSATTGCGGGYGGTFDVEAVAAIRQSVTGLHCFEVSAANADSLRLLVQGGDKPDTFFALR